MACCLSSSVTVTKPPLRADDPLFLGRRPRRNDNGGAALKKTVGDGFACALRASGHQCALAERF
jgi:hypothetical protein